MLDEARFALLYHAALAQQRRADTSLLPTLRRAVAHPENSAYADQLAFAEALLLHGAGQEQRARQLLSPLAAGSSPTAAYYQYLLGLWQLRQGQYGTAAGQLARATANGVPTAAVAQAYALALADQPDSARAVATRLAASPDTTRRRLGRQLASQLLAGKSGFLNSPARLPGVIAAAATTAALQQLAPAAASRAAPAGSELLRRARLAELQNQPSAAAAQYARLLREAPFNESAVLAATHFYTRGHDYAAAHEALRRGLDENPESAVLLEVYVLAAAQAGLGDYATDALRRLRPRLSPAAYATLQSRLAAARAAREATTADFNAIP